MRGITGLKQTDAKLGMSIDKYGEPEEIPYWEKAVRQDRKPKDSTLKLHTDVDAWFNKKFGFKARSQAVFCYGERALSTAAVSQYGEICVIFPIGEFEYVWSPNVQDLYTAKSREMTMYPEDATDAEKEKYTPLEFFMENMDYINTDLDKAVTQQHEIMVKCDKYYAIRLADANSIRLSLSDD